MKNVQAVAIEAGHGISNIIPGLKDPGVTIKLSDGTVIKEHDIAKEIAIMTVNILKTKPELSKAIVTGIGTSEKGASINDKVKYFKSVVNNNRLDIKKTIGVAIHVNSGGGKGVESFYQSRNQEGKIVGKYVTDSVNLYTGFGFHNTAVKPDSEYSKRRLYISDYAIGGKYSNFILLEIGFIDNELERNYILYNKQRISESIAHGILEYIRL